MCGCGLEMASYASDTWSLGLVLIECATGKYPYPEQSSCIEMVQMILDSPAPNLPEGAGFSDNFRDFVQQCTYIDPNMRLPVEVLLGAPWLEMHGATSYEAAVANVAAWIASMG